ncbi:MAG: hypothetical protein Q4A23_01010 [bacterium]|nr:hypothetical protein [bacterium]
MKKNLFSSVLDLFAPNHCYICNKIGNLVCNECLEKHNFQIQIIKRQSKRRPSREFFLGDREGVLAKILDDAKFNGWRENFEILALILSRSLKKNNLFYGSKDDIIIVPAPTSSRHARQRGVAHSEFMAEVLSNELSVETADIIARTSHFVQKGASAKVRKKQALEGYQLVGEINRDKIYVILDDIKTTGATIDSISDILLQAGAHEVWAVYLMRQKI